MPATTQACVQTYCAELRRAKRPRCSDMIRTLRLGRRTAGRTPQNCRCPEPGHRASLRPLQAQRGPQVDHQRVGNALLVGKGSAGILCKKLHRPEMSAGLICMSVPSAAWTRMPLLCSCGRAAPVLRLQPLAQSPVQQPVGWRQQLSQRAQPGGRCRARRADSPILAPVIPLGQDGQVLLYRRLLQHVDPHD